MKRILLKTALISILFTAGTSFAQSTMVEEKWGTSDYQKISTILSVYLGTNYIPKSSTDDFFIIMIQDAIKKFDDKVGRKIDNEDIKMLYGPDGKLGLVDYIRMVHGSQTPRPNILEISLRRILSYSLNSIASKIPMDELVKKYLGTISSQVEDEDIPVILDDGLLEYMTKAINTAKSSSERSVALLNVANTIYKLRSRKLNTDQLNVLAVNRSLFLEQVASHNQQKSKANLDYGDTRKAICGYLDIPVGYTLTIKELSSKAISKIILSDAAILSDEALELLVGKGNLYYYLVNEAEATPWAANNKYENMSKVTLLYTDINTRLALNKEFPYENIDALKADFMLFNWFYSPMTYWKDLPKIYEQARKERELSKVTKDGGGTLEEQIIEQEYKVFSADNLRKSDLRFSIEVFVGKKGLSDQNLLEEAFSLISANAELNNGALSQADIHNLILTIDFGSMVVSVSNGISPYIVNLVSTLKEVVHAELGPLPFRSRETINRSLKEFMDIKNSLKK